MNDIEILENVMEGFRKAEIEQLDDIEDLYQRFDYEDYIAVKNLINRVKELEKYKEYYEDMEEVNKKFIAVDKIKEKIENYNSKGYIEASGALQELLEE